MKKFFVASFVALVLGAGIFSQTAFASIWEWIQAFDVVGCDTTCAAGTPITLKRNVQTSASFPEVRAVWAAIVPGIVTTEPGLDFYTTDYRFLPGCYVTSTVNTSEWDVCDYTAVATSSYIGGPLVTSTLFLRATTKYIGCAGGESPVSTLAPDVTNCGDAVVRSRTITP